MVDEAGMEDDLGGGRGAAAETILKIITADFDGFHKMFGAYSGKDGIIKALKDMEDGENHIDEFGQALFVDKDKGDCSMAFADMDDADQNRAVEVFTSDATIRKWLVKTKKEKGIGM